MQATTELKREHDVIERALDLLDCAVQRIESGGSAPDGFPRWAVDFFRTFADRCHHAKEEDLLFPLLEQRGIPCEGGPIGVMLSEHTLGRECVRQMGQATQGAEPDEALFARAARQYLPLLRQHIFKENHVLFEMADRVLTADEDKRLVHEFEIAQQRQVGQGVHGRFVADLERWEQVFQGHDKTCTASRPLPEPGT